jgi:hypothetical protein
MSTCTMPTRRTRAPRRPRREPEPVRCYCGDPAPAGEFCPDCRREYQDDRAADAAVASGRASVRPTDGMEGVDDAEREAVRRGMQAGLRSYYGDAGPLACDDTTHHVLTAALDAALAAVIAMRPPAMDPVAVG